jgi:hypothetical protein
LGGLLNDCQLLANNIAAENAAGATIQIRCDKERISEAMSIAGGLYRKPAMQPKHSPEIATPTPNAKTFSIRERDFNERSAKYAFSLTSAAASLLAE